MNGDGNCGWRGMILFFFFFFLLVSFAQEMVSYSGEHLGWIRLTRVNSGRFWILRKPLWSARCRPRAE